MAGAKRSIGRNALERASRALAGFGYTPLESRVYVCLLLESPASGYRVAQTLSRPVANVYKALESLHRKGAVLATQTGSTQRYRAIQPSELFGAMEHEFRQRRLSIERQLGDFVGSSSADDGIYSITERDQVLSRCRAMIRGSRDVVVADLSPRLVAMVADELQSAHARGVIVKVQTYGDVALRGIDWAVAVDADEYASHWDGHWLDIVVDGRELLTAYLDRDAQEVYFGVWSRNPFLAWVHHSAKAAEFVLARFADTLQRDGTPSVKRRFSKYVRELFRRHPSGLKEVLRRTGETT